MDERTAARRAGLGDEMTQTTTITRDALQKLVNRIPGLIMDWNDGYPRFMERDPGLPGMEASMTPGEMGRHIADQARRRARRASDADVEAAEKLLGPMSDPDVGPAD